MREFNRRRYWLIGASEGLGRALAGQLSRAGAEVIATARSEERLAELVRDLPGSATHHVADVTEDGALDAVAREIGPVDGMVYLSGVLTQMHARSWDTQVMLNMIDVNLQGAVRAIGAVLPGMIERNAGHIVLTGSLAAYRGLPDFAGYSASKAGLNSLAESLRADLEPTNVALQIVNPGYIRTNMTAGMGRRVAKRAMSAEDAANLMFAHMQGESFARNFPLPLGLGAQTLQLLPDWLYFSFMGRKK